MRIKTTIVSKTGETINFEPNENPKRYALVEPNKFYNARIVSVKRSTRSGRDGKVYLSLMIQVELDNPERTLVTTSVTVGNVNAEGELIPSDRGDLIWTAAAAFFHAVGAMIPIKDEAGNFNGEYELDFDERFVTGIVVRVKIVHESYQKIVDGAPVTRTKNTVAVWLRPNSAAVEEGGYFVDENGVVWESAQTAETNERLRLTSYEREDASQSDNPDWV